jgi:hypothetical protein
MDDKQKKQPQPMPGKPDQAKDRDKKPQSANVGNKPQQDDPDDDDDNVITQRNPRIQDNE